VINDSARCRYPEEKEQLVDNLMWDRRKLTADVVRCEMFFGVGILPHKTLWHNIVRR